MAVKQFPPVESADEHGILAIGGDLEVSTLILAYRGGIFPWPIDQAPLLWWAVPKRAILMLKDFHISRSLAKEVKRSPYEIRFNCNFREIISACGAVPRRRQRGESWITPEMIEGYSALFDAGYAYCVGAYDSGNLVGGVYGVRIERFVSAESMFHLKPNASKLCLVELFSRLPSEGIEWVDFQVINSFTKSLGAKEISRRKFMQMLSDLFS